MAAEGVQNTEDQLFFYRDDRIGHEPDVVAIGAAHGVKARRVLRTNWDAVRKRRIVLSTNELVLADGSSLKRLQADDGLPEGINELCVAQNGDVWLAADHEVFRYDGKDFTEYKLNGQNYRASAFIREDHDGRIWA